jgi:hypothetical protein
MPTDKISGFVPIKTEDQKAIFNFVVSEGLGSAGKIDGKLGPETRKAIENVKNYFAKLYPQNLRMNDQQAFRAAKLPQQ